MTPDKSVKYSNWQVNSGGKSPSTATEENIENNSLHQKFLKVLLIVISFLTPAVVTAESSKAEITEAKNTLYECLYRISGSIDDGVTNVDTIARVAASSCSREGLNFVDVMIKDHYPIDKEKILAFCDGENINSAAYFILKNRARRK